MRYQKRIDTPDGRVPIVLKVESGSKRPAKGLTGHPRGRKIATVRKSDTTGTADSSAGLSFCVYLVGIRSSINLDRLRCFRSLTQTLGSARTRTRPFSRDVSIADTLAGIFRTD